MKIDEYFRSLTAELKAMQNRVRQLIEDRHWLSDGEWKESVLRTILRRHLPQHIGVGRGFYLTPSGKPSSQIDVLVYDTMKPILFQDGDFVILTADALVALIEVKTGLHTSELIAVVNKMTESRKQFSKEMAPSPFVGIFAYDDHDIEWPRVLSHLHKEAKGYIRHSLHAISIGQSQFLRYWSEPPEEPMKAGRSLWRAYRLENMAPAYFIHNVIEHVAWNSIQQNAKLWYPMNSKESYKIAEQVLGNPSDFL